VPCKLIPIPHRPPDLQVARSLLAAKTLRLWRPKNNKPISVCRCTPIAWWLLEWAFGRFVCSRWVGLLVSVFWQGFQHLERLWVLVCAHFEPFLQGVHPSILRFLMHKTLESADRRSRCRRSGANKREKGG
jgi:hypothetical protein